MMKDRGVQHSKTGNTQVISFRIFDIFVLVQDMFYRHILQAHGGGVARIAVGRSMPKCERLHDGACEAFS